MELLLLKQIPQKPINVPKGIVMVHVNLQFFPLVKILTLVQVLHINISYLSVLIIDPLYMIVDQVIMDLSSQSKKIISCLILKTMISCKIL